MDEARKLGHSYVGTEHILLGLIREGEGVAARVLNLNDFFSSRSIMNRLRHFLPAPDQTFYFFLNFI